MQIPAVCSVFSLAILSNPLKLMLMKPSYRFLFASLFCLLPGLNVLRAEIVSIDFQKVFEQFYELRQEDQKLREEVAAFQQAQQRKVQELQAKQETFNQLRNQAAQPETTDVQRKEMVTQATTQLEELNREEQALRQERTQFQKDLEAKGLRLRRGIVDKVNAKIAEIAKEQGWEMVFDASAKSPNGLPVIAYVTEAKDKTEWIIRELNSKVAVPAAAAE